MAWLSDERICVIYRDSANRPAQIKILSELTLYSVDHIAQILRDHGYVPEMPKKYKSAPPKPKRRWSVDEYLAVWRMYNCGASIKRIAKECDRSTKSIETAINGLTRRPGYITTKDMLTAIKIYERERSR